MVINKTLKGFYSSGRFRKDGDGVFCKLCLVRRVDCPLFTVQLDSGQSTFNASFFLSFVIFG